MDLPVQPPAAIRLDRALRDRIVGHLAAAVPLEGVGLLAAAEDAAGVRRAVRYYPGTNVEASPTSYTMDPAEVLAALRDIDANGWFLGAIVHSHPATSPVPSPTDLRRAHYPDALMVIASLAIDPPHLRAWWLGGDGARSPYRPVEVPVLLTESVAGG